MDKAEEKKQSRESDICALVLLLADVSAGGIPIEEMNAMLEAPFIKMQPLLGDGVDNCYLNILSYADNCHWSYPTFVSLEDFKFQPLMEGGEAANLGAAFLELNEQLRIENIARRFNRIMLILLSSGKVSDSIEEGLAALRKKPFWDELVRSYSLPTEPPLREALGKDFILHEWKRVLPNGMEVPDLYGLFFRALLQTMGGFGPWQDKPITLRRCPDDDAVPDEDDADEDGW